MKCHVINLDRSPDRLKAFSREAEQAGIRFERFAAIDGKLVPESFLFAQQADSFELQPINRFETALFLSHRSIWQKLADSNEDMCAIFEDDVLLAPDLAEALSLVSALAEPFDVVKLETTRRTIVIERSPVVQGDHYFLSGLKSWHGGAAAYVVSRRGALKLLEKTVKLADPVDQVLFNPQTSVSRSLRILQLVPAAAIQIQFSRSGAHAAPQTTAGRDEKPRSGIRHGFWIDTRRAVKRLSGGLLMRWLAKHPENRQLRVGFASCEDGDSLQSTNSGIRVNRQ